jgi:quercetin dioxygenase-like cupin family protein
MELLRLESREGEVMVHRPGRELRVLVDRDEAVVAWYRYAAGEDGADDHFHRDHTDAFLVLDGELLLRVDGNDVRAPAGTLVAAPPLVVHAFRNASDAEARFLNFHVPNAGFAEMLRARRDDRDPRIPWDSVDAAPGEGRPAADAVVAHLDAGAAEVPTPIGPLRVGFDRDAAGRDVVRVEIGHALEVVAPR